MSARGICGVWLTQCRRQGPKHHIFMRPRFHDIAHACAPFSRDSSSHNPMPRSLRSSAGIITATCDRSKSRAMVRVGSIGNLVRVIYMEWQLAGTLPVKISIHSYVHNPYKKRILSQYTSSMALSHTSVGHLLSTPPPERHGEAARTTHLSRSICAHMCSIRVRGAIGCFVPENKGITQRIQRQTLQK